MLFGLVVAIALLYVQGRVAEMDDRLFQPSVHGIQGLFQYQLGRYGPAAAAYRADLRNDGWKEWQNGDEAYAALLRGNLSEAARLADLRLRSNQTMRKPGSRRARSHWKKETSDVPQMRSITRHY